MTAQASLPARSPRRRRAATLAVAVTVGALLLAACGSRIAPEQVLGAGGVAGAGSQAGVLEGGDSSFDGSDPAAGGDAGSVSGGGGGAEPGSSGDGSGGSSGGSSGGGSGGGDAPSGEGENSATGGTKAASCAGFKNQTGMTNDRITLANVADVSGPVPGIFESARQGARAYAAYFNASSDLCGRKLEILALDSRADAGADQQAYTRACTDAFAAVGSMSAFDSGGAGAAERCGLPDVRSTAVTKQRGECKTCFSAQPVRPNLVGDAMPKFFQRTNREATQNVGLVFINAGAAPDSAESMRRAWTKSGWKVKYFQGIDIAEFNYAPYVQKFKDNGVQMVVYIGNYQNTVKLQQAMKQQSYKPKVFLQDGTVYDSRYVEQAGDLAEGTYSYIAWEMFEDERVKEMVLYRQWLNQIDPGAVPTGFGLFAWSASRLFVEEARKLGGKLTRASLVDGLGKVRAWDANGLHVPQAVGPKTTTPCAKIIQFRGGKWQQLSRGKFECGRLVDSGFSG
ncbi:MAG: ABC transporter substrate-binding protein [Nocardioides sp.]|nr:ABC transporter substrate-binding protein [Nocardioides sp.]